MQQLELEPLDDQKCRVQRCHLLSSITCLLTLCGLLWAVRDSRIADSRTSTAALRVASSQETCCTITSCCRAQPACVALHEDQFGGHNLTHYQICGSVALPHTQLHRMQSMAKHGITFAGSAAAKRLYVRAVIHLHGGVLQEGAAEMLQRPSTSGSVQLRLFNLTAADGAFMNQYAGPLHDEPTWNLQYVRAAAGVSMRWPAQVRARRYMYYALPLAEMLSAGPKSGCPSESHMRDQLNEQLSGLQRLAVESSIRIVIGTSALFSKKEVLHHQSQSTDCDVFTDTNTGLEAANQMLVEAVSQFSQLRVLRVDQAMELQSERLYAERGLFVGVALDAQLSGLVDVLHVWESDQEEGSLAAVPSQEGDLEGGFWVHQFGEETGRNQTDEAVQDAKDQLTYELNMRPRFGIQQNPLFEGNKAHNHPYAWASTTKLPPFSPSEMCQQLTGGVLFVGDVHGQQQYTALRVELESVGVQTALRTADWYPEHLEQDNTVQGVMAFKACNGTRLVAFVRNDWLDIRPSGSLFGPVVVSRGLRQCDERPTLYGEQAFCAPWADAQLVRKFQVVVLSTGARFRSNGVFCEGFRKTVSWLKSAVQSAARVFYRMDVPPTRGCERHLDTLPFESLVAAEAYSAANPLFAETNSKEQNQIVTAIIGSAGFEMLDVYSSSVLRRDGHRDNGDCLMYRMPSVLHHWNRLLLNLLINPDRPSKQPFEALQCPYFGAQGASITDCSSRDTSLLQHTLYNASRQEIIEAGNLCAEGVGRSGYLEQCCSLHQWETSGYGNQLLQIVNGLRFARQNKCQVLCLPDCTDSAKGTAECAAGFMWHGASMHVAVAFKLGSTVQIPPLLAATSASVPPVKPYPFYSTCIDGSRGGVTNGPGYPYCYFDPMPWPQARADLSRILNQDSEPLPDDELVLHVRSGDVLLAMNDWLKNDATSDSYDEFLPNLHAFNLQPGCGFHLDAALRGYNGGPFSKVHLMADTRCAGTSLADMHLRGSTTFESRLDLSCASTNPCIRKLVERLAPGVLVVTPRNMTATQAFQRDVGLMYRARNLAVTCSTFSILGRMASKYINRLFMPNCRMEYKPSDDQVVNGRRRQFSRLSRPHQTWEFLTATGHAFSQQEGGMTVVAYDFLWQESDVLAAAFGSRVLTGAEWLNLTGSARGDSIPKLLGEVEFNRTEYEAQDIPT